MKRGSTCVAREPECDPVTRAQRLVKILPRVIRLGELGWRTVKGGEHKFFPMTLVGTEEQATYPLVGKTGYSCVACGAQLPTDRDWILYNRNMFCPGCFTEEIRALR